MSDDGATDRIDPDERVWRETVERTVGADGGCCERVDGLRASRAEFDRIEEPAGGGRSRAAIGVLLVLAVPVFLYSELVTPSGAVNYAGMGTGLVLMIAASLAHL